MSTMDLLSRITTEDLIDQSIMDIVFKKGEDGKYLNYYFRDSLIIHTANAICLYTAILVHAYYFARCIKEGKNLFDISNEKLVPNQIAKFWKGGSDLQIGDAVSILIGMGKAAEGTCVDNSGVEVLHSWNSIFGKWQSNTRSNKIIFKNLYDLNALFIELVKSLKILRMASYNAPEERLYFNDGNETISIARSPFIHFYSETYSHSDGNFNISRAYIPVACSITDNVNYVSVKFFDPYAGSDDRIESPIFFSQKQDTHEAERAIFKIAGVELIDSKIEYEGNFKFLDNFIKATVTIFRKMNEDFRGLPDKYKEEVFKSFLTKVNPNNNYQQKVLDFYDLENVLWICAIQDGILEFAKKIIAQL